MATIRKKKDCPVCSTSHRGSETVFGHYWKCDYCGSLWMKNQIKINYKKDYYYRGIDGWWMRIIDRFSFWDRYRSIDIKKTDQILEIGFGEGKFLRELFKMGYKVSGLDVSAYARDKMAKVIGANHVYQDPGEIEKKFELILMYQVLEHIENPQRYIKTLTTKLVDGGRIIIRVPNVNSWEARLGGNDWYHLDYPNHVTLFSDFGLVEMMKNVGFEGVVTRKNMLEYRQVLGYSILSAMNIRLSRVPMIIYQLVTIPILWIFSALMLQHGVIELEGIFRSANSNRVSNKHAGSVQSVDR